jgi:UDP:flavonoid glycosyltransferase YjiC (YdhE family)
MAKFLAFAPAAAGHVFPLVPGLLALQARGHTVQIRTGEELVDVLSAAGLDAVPSEVVRLDGAHTAKSGRLRHGLATLLARAPSERLSLERAIAETDPDAILVDTNAFGAAVAAERSGRRWATTIPSLLPLPGAGIPPYGLGLPRWPGLLGAVRDRLLWRLVERQFGRSLLPGVNALRRDASLAPLASPFDHLRAPDRLLVLTGEPLEYPRRDLPPHVRLVGPQLWDPPAVTPAWLLEDGDPWVLVTCSTGYQGDEQLAAAANEALRDAPVRVVVTLAEAHGTAELRRAGNVRLERFVPHGPILERAVAVVCHSGMGIVQKALAASVPVVAVPFGRDQPEVARRVAEAGAGIALSAKRLSAATLRAAVNDAIALRPRLDRLAARLDAAGAPDRFAAAAEELIQAGR